MRILFMGTGEFGVPTLNALLGSRHEVVGVVTQPDRPKGRGREMHISPIKGIALDAGIPVYQPEKVGSEDFIEQVREMLPDAFVVVAFGQIIPRALLDIPKYGSVNVHASLLPKYRGAAPIHYALFNGEGITGVTTMLMDSGLDTGPILLQEELKVLPEDSTGTLEERLSQIGAPLLLRTLEGLEDGSISPTPQEDSQATYAPSIKREDCLVDWNTSATDIANRVRGCTPRPGAFTFFEGAAVKIWSCRAEEGAGNPGEVVRVDNRGIAVGAAEDIVIVSELQPENRKRMGAADFAHGARIAPGARFDPRCHSERSEESALGKTDSSLRSE